MAVNQESKDILKAVIEIGEALSDGIQLSDIGALMHLPAAIDGWGEGVAGLKEAVQNDREELISYVTSEFDIADDEVEKKIEKSLEWLSATYELYLLWKPEEEVE